MTIRDTDTMTIRDKYARVYIDPPQDDCCHSGYQGRITADKLGVHIPADCDYLPTDVEYDDGTDWEPIGVACLIPWHRVYSIEWPDRRARETP